VADVLRVSNEGLQVLAAHCDAISAGLAAAAPVPSVGPLTQATSGAVGAAYAALDGAITVLAGRTQATAVKAALAGTEFAASDGASAQVVAAVDPV
jgi:hypothetical protein